MRVLITFGDDDPAVPDGATLVREIVEAYKARGLVDVRDEARNPEHFLPSMEEVQAQASQIFTQLVMANRTGDAAHKHYVGRLTGQIEALLWVLGVGEL